MTNCEELKVLVYNDEIGFNFKVNVVYKKVLKVKSNYQLCLIL